MATVAAAFFGVVAAAPATAGGGPDAHRIVDMMRNRWPEVALYHDAGAPVRQRDCNGGANPQWIEEADQVNTLRNANSGMGLDTAGPSTTNDTDAIHRWPRGYDRATVNQGLRAPG
ncbi:RICIN domain-containing protein [Streptomyces sp. NPDC056160]|uniref:RICIN domain-containing protein n=1 Tax=Streptomyces sp. NPDC056160 TaxID=3345731 RepID=UPI0035E1757F